MANAGAEGNFILFRKSTGISHNSFGDMGTAKDIISEYENPAEWELTTPDGRQRWGLVYSADVAGWIWRPTQKAEADELPASRHLPKDDGGYPRIIPQEEALLYRQALEKIESHMREGRYIQIYKVLREALD